MCFLNICFGIFLIIPALTDSSQRNVENIESRTHQLEKLYEISNKKRGISRHDCITLYVWLLK